MESSVTFSLLYLLFLSFPVVGTFSNYENRYNPYSCNFTGFCHPGTCDGGLFRHKSRMWGFRAGVEAELDGSGGGEGSPAEPQSPSVTGNVADFVLSSFHPAGLRHSR